MLYSFNFFSSNNWDIVTFLVKGKNCDLDAKDKDGKTLLHYAMRSVRINLILKLNFDRIPKLGTYKLSNDRSVFVEVRYDNV